MNQAPALIDRQVRQQPFHWTHTKVTQRLGPLAFLLGHMKMNDDARASSKRVHESMHCVRGYRSQTVQCHAEAGLFRRPDRTAKLIDLFGEALDSHYELALACRRGRAAKIRVHVKRWQQG